MGFFIYFFLSVNFGSCFIVWFWCLLEWKMCIICDLAILRFSFEFKDIFAFVRRESIIGLLR